MDERLNEETRRAAHVLYRRFGRDAAVIALQNRQRARAQAADADACAWQRIYRAVLELEERAADTEWIEGRNERRNLTRVVARGLAVKD